MASVKQTLINKTMSWKTKFGNEVASKGECEEYYPTPNPHPDPHPIFMKLSGFYQAVGLFAYVVGFLDNFVRILTIFIGLSVGFLEIKNWL